ncbi:uncharacterized protein [Paramisgurnus dabryanus]|uniref:uncharacterized protein isoform X2 n=1 Tax=Paramisgurnus dabryanus TaxID=90735 RepID=UPI0031F39290
MTSWRIAVIIFTVSIQQVWGGDEITGYAGQSVVLKSGVDTSWNLAKVEWSILKNTTYIATLRDGVLAENRFWRYKGRLELNNKTGDLTIKNVRIDDSMIYTVTLVNKSETREEKKFDLTVKGYTDITKPILWMEFSGNRNVTLNCIASSGQQTESKQITVGCVEEIIMPEPHRSCSCASMVFWGILCTAAVIILCGLLYAKKDKLKAAWVDGPLHVFQCLFKC